MSIKLAIFGVAALLASSAQAAITVYNSQAAYAAALGSSVTEDFIDPILVPGLSFTTNAGNIGGGLFNDRVFRGGDETTFTFATPTKGFGAIFDLAPGGFGQALKFSINGSTLVPQELSGVSGSFFGFISDTAFTSVLIQAGNDAGVAETYNLDNLQFGAVPEPASWALMIGGFGLVGATMRRRVALTA